ncbi:MAG: alpha/beta hydrolase [Prolixibacteraceae bacterium]
MKQVVISVLIVLIAVLGNAQINKHVVYKQVEAVKLTMDIYFPDYLDTTDTYPAMVFYSGGGWRILKDNQFEFQAKYFASKGIVCFLANYRVSSRNQTSPIESLEDAKSAIRYVREHSEEFHIDTAKIVASGGSAGGHLAAATALVKKFNDNIDDLEVSCKPNALILFNPVLDNGPGGSGYDRIGDKYKDFSPLHNIKKGAPPTIVFLGTKDEYIPVVTTQYYKMVMEKVGSRCDLKLYDGEGHGFFNHNRIENYKRTVFEAHEFLYSLGYLHDYPNMEEIK